MFLSKHELSMLSGRHGYAKQKSMEIIVALGKIFGADRLIDIRSVQVAGVSFHNLGDAGIEYIEGMATEGRIARGVNATLNPAGMDIKSWKSMGIAPSFARKQMRIVKAYSKIGIDATCTCIPYLINNRPRHGEHAAWSESSAVCYINSVIGAKTNREGGPSSLASAITGKTANYGFHISSNRKCEVAVDVKCSVSGEAEFGALGHAIGEKAKNRVLYIRGLDTGSITKRDMQSFCASSATYGATALFHIEGYTPDWRSAGRARKRIGIDKGDIKKSFSFINDKCDPDFIAVGCPHFWVEEIRMMARLLDGKKVAKEMWIFVPRSALEMMKRDFPEELGTIKKSGARLVADTCMAVAPLRGMFRCIATNSAKACFYARGSNSFSTMLCSTEDCVKYATGEEVKRK